MVDNNTTVANSWVEAKRLAYEERYNTKVELPKGISGPLPSEFKESSLSLRLGANAVYRDQRDLNSYQVREYDDYWTVEVDRFNPERGYVIRHAVLDAPLYTFGAVVLGATFFGSLTS